MVLAAGEEALEFVCPAEDHRGIRLVVDLPQYVYFGKLRMVKVFTFIKEENVIRV